MKSSLRLLSLCVVLIVVGSPLFAETSVLKSRESLQVGDETRYYTLSRPEKIEPGQTYPLIIGFHGNRSQVKAWLHDYTRFDHFIAEKQFIIAYPEGPIRWEASTEGHDLPFFDALIAQLKKNYAIDDQRIYVFGHSNGGGFATFLLCARPEVIAAVAAHSGIYPPRAHRLPLPEHKGPLFIIWGENDEMAPAASERVQASIKNFQESGFSVETLVLPKWGHSWGGQPNQVEEKILSFFLSHSLVKTSGATSAVATKEAR